jgi:hypothetical protein
VGVENVFDEHATGFRSVSFSIRFHDNQLCDAILQRNARFFLLQNDVAANAHPVPGMKRSRTMTPGCSQLRRNDRAAHQSSRGLTALPSC